MLFVATAILLKKKSPESVDACHAPFSFAVLIFCGLYLGHEANCEMHNYVGVKLANGHGIDFAAAELLLHF